jgi:uncharacterized protein with von Willebrand factor type A (vWA) domain
MNEESVKGLLPKVDGGAVYPTTRWSNLMWADHIAENNDARKVVEDGLDKSPQFSDFAGEIFNRLYTYEEPEQKDDVPVEYEWMKNAHSQATELKEFKSLREQSQGDETWSGVSAAAIADEIRKVVPEPKEDTEKINDTRQQMAGLNSLLQQMIEEDNDGTQEQQQEVSEQLQQLQAQYDAMGQSLQNQAAAMNGAKVRQAIRNGSAKASEKIEQMEGALSAYGWGNDPGQPGVGGNKKVKQALAKKVMRSDKLKRIAEIAGRMRNIAAEKQANKTDYARSEVTEVEKGGDVSRILPAEIMKLADPDLENLFFANMANGSLLQYRIEGKEKQAQGPIVMAIDNSGSMSGEPEYLSKGIALGLLEVAVRQKRAVHVVHFDTQIQATLVIDPRKPQTLQNVDELIEFMEFFSCGGTCIDVAMDHLMGIIESAAEGESFKSADVILISDDCWDGKDAWYAQYNERAKRLGVNTYNLMMAAGSMTSFGEKINATTLAITDLIDDPKSVAGTLYSKL